MRCSAGDAEVPTAALVEGFGPVVEPEDRDGLSSALVLRDGGVDRDDGGGISDVRPLHVDDGVAWAFCPVEQKIASEREI